MTIKINSLELENVKRIKAVKVEPNQNGLNSYWWKKQPGQDIGIRQYCMGTGWQ